MLRSRTPFADAAERLATREQKQATIEFDLVPVTRLNVVLDNGVPLQFDLEKDHSYTQGEQFLTVTQGKRIFQIAASRVLYTDTFPTEMKRIRGSLAEQLSALQKQ